LKLQKVGKINARETPLKVCELEDLGDLLVLQGTTKSTRKKSQEGVRRQLFATSDLNYGELRHRTEKRLSLVFMLNLIL